MTITEMQDICFKNSVAAGWWELKDGQTVDDLVPVKLCLIHSEVSEAMEGHRKNLMDDKLPHRSMLEVELADAMIRIFDLAGATGLDLEGALNEKLEYNKVREDHTPEHRASKGGKRY
jgi:NTP pyrophosphatase (non-canonical NTP hydrolase)